MAGDVLTFIDAAGVETTLIHGRGMTGRWMPPVILNDEAVPGQDGTLVRNVRYDARQVVVPIVLLEPSRNSYRDAVRSLVRRLDPKRGDGILRSSYNGVTRDLRCRYLDGMGFDEKFLDIGTPSLLFRAADPFWYDTTSMTSTFTTGAQPAFLGDPFLPLRLASDTVLGEQTLVNDGDVEAWPVWTVKGPASSITLENVTTGQVIDLPVALTAAQSVVIDTRPFKKTVRRDDGTNLFGSMLTGSALWAIGQGSVQLRATIPGSTAETFVTLVFSRRWLSA